MRGEVLGVFMKAPVPGKCKTRLCPPLTDHEAAILYQAFCQDVLAMAQKTKNIVRIIYESSPDFPTPQWAVPKYPFFHQKGDDLGERLKNAFAQLFSAGYSRVIFIGSDLPTLAPHVIKSAFALLKQNEAVFGPATDGGYYLVGLSKPHPPIFEGIPWSTDQVMRVTQGRLGELKIPAVYLPMESDVDTGKDLTRLMDELKSAASTNAPATRRAVSNFTFLRRST